MGLLDKVDNLDDKKTAKSVPKKATPKKAKPKKAASKKAATGADNEVITEDMKAAEEEQAKKDAAKAVTTTKKGNQVNVTEKKIWTVDEISKLKPYEFDKHEKDIMAARREGRIKRN